MTGKKLRDGTRLWIYTNVKVLIGVSFSIFIVIILMEIILRFINYGDPNERYDPFNGFEGTNPVFRKMEQPDGTWQYSPSPNKRVADQSFPIERLDKTYRIFTFGGSTTRGVPWGSSGSFSFWLEEDLRLLYPDINFEVINTGISGYGSSRVLEVMKEMVHYEPDLFIVYTGQNEFRDGYFHRSKITRGALKAKIYKGLFSSRAVYFIYHRSLLLKDKILGKSSKSYAEREIEHILSTPFSEETFKSFDYYRIPDLYSEQYSSSGIYAESKSKVKGVLRKVIEWRNLREEDIYSKFGSNIRKMIELANDHNIKIIFLLKVQNPMVVNLISPAKAETTSISAQDVSEWKYLYAKALRAVKEDKCEVAIRVFNEILEDYSDIRNDLIYLYLGKCYEGLGMYDEARQEYEKRFSEKHNELNRILRSILIEERIPLIEVYKLFVDRAINGIIGYRNYFIDNAHMTLEGYSLIGDALSDLIHQRGFIPSKYQIPPTTTIDRLNQGNQRMNILDQFITAHTNTSLGWSAFNQGKLNEALEYGKSAVMIDANKTQAHLLLGYVYSKLNRISEAEAEWDKLNTIWKK